MGGQNEANLGIVEELSELPGVDPMAGEAFLAIGSRDGD